MADIPHFQFPKAVKQYPFLNLGLDFFGPFYIEHRNHKLEKIYLCSCLVTRAVHPKFCQTLDTDICSLAIKRFLSRQKYPELIIPVNGSNLTPAKKMLNLSKVTVDNNYTKSQLQQQNITRNLNSPQAYHFSGI